MDTQQFLVFLLEGGGGALVYFLLKKNAWYESLSEPDMKRWIAFGLTGLIAVAAWGGQILLGFAELPTGGLQPIIVTIGDVLLGVFAAFGTSQLLHTKELRRE